MHYPTQQKLEWIARLLAAASSWGSELDHAHPGLEWRSISHYLMPDVVLFLGGKDSEPLGFGLPNDQEQWVSIESLRSQPPQLYVVEGTKHALGYINSQIASLDEGQRGSAYQAVRTLRRVLAVAA